MALSASSSISAGIIDSLSGDYLGSDRREGKKPRLVVAKCFGLRYYPLRRLPDVELLFRHYVKNVTLLKADFVTTQELEAYDEWDSDRQDTQEIYYTADQTLSEARSLALALWYGYGSTLFFQILSEDIENIATEIVRVAAALNFSVHSDREQYTELIPLLRRYLDVLIGAEMIVMVASTRLMSSDLRNQLLRRASQRCV